MRQTKRRITLSCLLKIRYGFLRIEEVESRVVIPSSQILVVRLRICRRVPCELAPLLRDQLQLHLIRNRRGPATTRDLTNPLSS